MSVTGWALPHKEMLETKLGALHQISAPLTIDYVSLKMVETSSSSSSFYLLFYATLLFRTQNPNNPPLRGIPRHFKPSGFASGNGQQYISMGGPTLYKVYRAA